jgi:hypothetical protein
MQRSCTSIAMGIMGLLGLMALSVPTAAAPPPAKSPTAPHRAPTTHQAAFHPEPLPLPADQTIEKQNSDFDLLRVETTFTVAQNGKYVAYVRMIWGDPDHKQIVNKTGKKWYSNWDGELNLTGATGTVDKKYHFNDGLGDKVVAPKPGKAGTMTKPSGNKAGEGPGPGSGRDELENISGAKIVWKAGVTGMYDGLRMKLTSDSPTFTATVKAGNFTVPVTFKPRP